MLEDDLLAGGNLKSEFSLDLTQRLRQLRELDSHQREALVERLTKHSPISPWPYGMPMCVAPYVVLLGPSPGNSPRSCDQRDETRGRADPKPTCGEAPKGFGYPDGRKYWSKASDLCGFLVGRKANLSQADALCLSGALNLGTGQHGTADKEAIEHEIVPWVSELLNTALAPTILVVWGLWGLIRSPSIVKLWNHPRGLRIDWENPQREVPVHIGKKLKLRFWRTTHSDGHDIAVLMWPNHPSRFPFAGGPEQSAWLIAKQAADVLLKEEGF